MWSSTGRDYMMHIIGACLLATAIAMTSGIADAAEYRIYQKGKQFSVTTLSAQVGDTVVFVNVKLPLLAIAPPNPM